MKWRGLERSRNVEDRRGARSGPMLAGAGGLGLIAVVIVMLLSGGSGGGLDLEGLMEGLGTQAPASTPQSLSPEEEAEGEFVAAVLGTTETYWGDEFSAAGDAYPAPTLVLFTGATSSRCGGGDDTDRSPLLPRRRDHLRRPRFLHRASPTVWRQWWRLRRGIRHCTRGRSPHPKGDRRDGPGADGTVAEPGATKRVVGSHGIAGRLLRRGVGQFGSRARRAAARRYRRRS